MDNEIWNKTLTVLSHDTRVDSVIYDSILSKMKLVYFENNTLILSCRDEYSLSLVKNKELSSLIRGAATIVNNGESPFVSFVLEGDENAALATTVASKKASTTQQSNYSVPITGLSDAFTFDNFVVGDCNRFAHASAVSVANRPGPISRNPLFLWGNSGLGKTHLMQAIGNSVQKNLHKTVLYASCENFTDQFVNSLREKNIASFRNKYRNVDVLLIDDIQYLIGKAETQIEFFNTFEALISAGKQIVITCDKAPKNLTELEERLTSRFQSGMTMDIQPPDFETRKAIIQSKLKNDVISLSDDIVNYMCENVTSNVRELNGAYNVISSFYALSNGDITLETAQTVLTSFISPNKKRILTTEIITNAVSQYYDISPDKMKSKVRSSEILIPRSVAMYICRDLLGMQLAKIGAFFGGRNHTTVLNACSRIESSPSIMKEIEEIKAKLQE
ncbi:MAG: chromosomal replication initiator protein DnaA [Clostridiaceae bacterium]|nr:chromosomal replication initiator protein DnaA [Clostridia bacterium]NLX69056.1 chromosomal replication initiator protein DnaA [Clostridiaceae bacterium]